MRVARKAPGVEEGELARAAVPRRILRPRRRNVLAEIRETPANRDPEAGGRCVVTLLELAERVVQLLPGGAQVARAHLRGHQLVMQRRNEHLHAVVLNDADGVEHVLLGRERRHRFPPRRRAAELVDELVHAGTAERRDERAGQRFPSRQLHARTRTRPRRIWLRTPRTFA